jgi:hypothetical protein
VPIRSRSGVLFSSAKMHAAVLPVVCHAIIVIRLASPTSRFPPPRELANQLHSVELSHVWMQEA